MSRHVRFRRFARVVRCDVAIAVLALAVIVLPARPVAAAEAGAAAAAASATVTPTRGPQNIADVAEQVIDAVVNVSTSETVNPQVGDIPDLPPGSPMQKFFQDFFKHHHGMDGDAEDEPHRINSLGSGFIIDPSGLIVTNNHVIEGADEIHVILNDGTRLKADLVGKDAKSDLALLRVHYGKPLKFVKFGDSDKVRLGEWVIAIGNPFSLGGTVTAGIVSARNRDIDSGPYDNYIQTDAPINRGNSGGPLFDLNGEVIGINTAIISPSGGSIGIGFAIPSDSAIPVIDQLQKYGEARRGWLGVRIQQVTDEIAESLNISPPHGALVAGVDPKGPAKPAGIETGDVIVSFDGHDIKEMRDLPRIVADTPVGKEVDVVLLRNGKQETRKVVVGRLKDDQKVADAGTKKEGPPEPKSVVQKTLGLELSSLTESVRKKFKIGSSVKGVLVTGVEASAASDVPDKHLEAGDVIVEVQYQPVSTPADLQKRVDELKSQGKKLAMLLVSDGDGDTRFVALTLQ